MRRQGKGQLLKDRQKEVIRLKKKYDLLWKAKRSLPLIPLDKPVRAGWERNFIVREDVRKGPHGKFLEQLLTKLNNTEICKDKSFVAYNWKTGKIEPIEQDLKILEEKSYEALTLQEKNQFNKEFRIFKFWYTTEKRPVWVIKQPWRFVFKMKPHFLTHTRAIDGDIESEMEKLSDKLWGGDRMAYKYGNHGYNSDEKDWNVPIRKIKAKLGRKEIEEWTTE